MGSHSKELSGLLLRDGDLELAGLELRPEMAGEVLYRQSKVFWDSGGWDVRSPVGGLS
jgi:hypothetical protein